MKLQWKKELFKKIPLTPPSSPLPEENRIYDTAKNNAIFTVAK